jgi:predicted ATPase
VNASGLPDFREVYDALQLMAFYNFAPDASRGLQFPDTGELLKHDGGNLASVLGRIQRQSDATRLRIIEYLSKVVPGVVDVEGSHYGDVETLVFSEMLGSDGKTFRLLPRDMSDGTLRALAILTALFQNDPAHKRVSLVGIEEPEAALHPGAAGVLRDALEEASLDVQVIVTSHSTDLLDDKDVLAEQIVSVSKDHGETRLGPIGGPAREAIKDQLYTPGELLRMGQLGSGNGTLANQELLFGEAGE